MQWSVKLGLRCSWIIVIVIASLLFTFYYTLSHLLMVKIKKNTSRHNGLYFTGFYWKYDDECHDRSIATSYIAHEFIQVVSCFLILILVFCETFCGYFLLLIMILSILTWHIAFNIYRWFNLILSFDVDFKNQCLWNVFIHH